MLKKILETKAYIFIGTLVTAGIITVTAYNLIMANEEDVMTKQANSEVGNNNYQEQIDKLKIELKETQNETEELKEKIVQLEGKVINLEDENANKDTTIASLQSQTIKLQQNNGSSSELNNVKKQLERTNEELLQVQTEKSDVKMKLKEMSAKREKLQNEIEALNNEIQKEIEYSINEIGNRREQLEIERDEIKQKILLGNYSKVEISKMEERKKEIENEIGDLEKIQKEVNEKNSERRQQIASKQQELEQLIIEMIELNK